MSAESGGLIALVLAAFVVVAGCAGNGPPPPGSTSAFDAIQRNIFSVSCLGCHSTFEQAGNLALDEGRSYANLVGVPPVNTAALAAGLLLVARGNPDQSFLLIKLTGPGPAEGSRMPLGAPPLAPEQIDQIRAWILAGAPGPNGPSPTASVLPSTTASGTPRAAATATPSVSTAVSPTGVAPPTSTPVGTRLETPTSTPLPTGAFPTKTPSASPTPPVEPTPTFSLDSTLAQIQATIFTTTCLDAGCHNARDQAGGLVLEAGQSYAALVRAIPQNAAASAAGLLRVDPGSPDGSFLVTKLTLPTVFDPSFGSRMPLGKPPLDAAQIEEVRAWILRGALAEEAGNP